MTEVFQVLNVDVVWIGGFIVVAGFDASEASEDVAWKV